VVVVPLRVGSRFIPNHPVAKVSSVDEPETLEVFEVAICGGRIRRSGLNPSNRLVDRERLPGAKRELQECLSGRRVFELCHPQDFEGITHAFGLSPDLFHRKNR